MRHGDGLSGRRCGIAKAVGGLWRIAMPSPLKKPRLVLRVGVAGAIRLTDGHRADCTTRSRMYIA